MGRFTQVARNSIGLSLAAGVVALCVCTFRDAVSAQKSPTQGKDGASMKLESAVFQPMGAIPSKYTCEGQDISPPLAWHDVPENARSLALIVDDPDAPDPQAPKTTWVHWVVFNIPPIASGLPEGAKPLPGAAVEGLNDWKRTGYGGPCPPIGRHRYVHKLYALDTQLELKRPTKAELEAAIKGHILARAELIGTYEKNKK
jgi:Raf kinase inhibitor-like YbhB/YbcL family protein